MKFSPTSPRHEAGITIFLSNQYHDEVGVTVNPTTNATTVFVSTRIGPSANLTTTYYDVPKGMAEHQGVTLFIKGEPNQYSLGYAINGGNGTFVATVENKWLQSYLPG